jgi:hypothetical protein
LCYDKYLRGKKKLKGGKTYFGSQFEVSVHGLVAHLLWTWVRHSTMTAGMCGKTAHLTMDRKERDKKGPGQNVVSKIHPSDLLLPTRPRISSY